MSYSDTEPSVWLIVGGGILVLLALCVVAYLIGRKRPTSVINPRTGDEFRKLTPEQQEQCAQSLREGFTTAFNHFAPNCVLVDRHSHYWLLVDVTKEGIFVRRIAGRFCRTEKDEVNWPDLLDCGMSVLLSHEFRVESSTLATA
jgi:hypothetical protein